MMTTLFPIEKSKKKDRTLILDKRQYDYEDEMEMAEWNSMLELVNLFRHRNWWDHDFILYAIHFFIILFALCDLFCIQMGNSFSRDGKIQFTSFELSHAYTISSTYDPITNVGKYLNRNQQKIKFLSSHFE
jgi:hypothetical protein